MGNAKGPSSDSGGGKVELETLRERAELARRHAQQLRAQGQAGRDARADRGAVAMPNLSPREREVLGLLAAGLTTKEIALHLGIKSTTTNYHVANVYRKIKARGRVDAANAYRRLFGHEVGERGAGSESGPGGP